ncbi:unnamed protein product [Paramecium sonneborni]|uniref:Uncharacterized protein n=1 Tax=Paramecium sonneborni TaxID=65129 RepID=A0A8S1QW32_9CILI|nr:unnamed protein product [Paramecium sonneborni]CAD8119422.1 unnamed protein product [Paramecium sonneborni]
MNVLKIAKNAKLPIIKIYALNVLLLHKQFKLITIVQNARIFITKICRYIINRFPNLKGLLITKQQRRKKIEERWAKVKEFLFRKAERILIVKRYTPTNKTENYYLKQQGISSPSPINSYRIDAIKEDMIDSQLKSSTRRKQNIIFKISKLLRLQINQGIKKIKLNERNFKLKKNHQIHRMSVLVSIQYL